MGLFDALKEKAGELLQGGKDQLGEAVGIEPPAVDGVADQATQAAEGVTQTGQDAAEGAQSAAEGAATDALGKLAGQ